VPGTGAATTGAGEPAVIADGPGRSRAGGHQKSATYNRESDQEGLGEDLYFLGDGELRHGSMVPGVES
jgi:hypothetical protein